MKTEYLRNQTIQWKKMCPDLQRYFTREVCGYQISAWKNIQP